MPTNTWEPPPRQSDTRIRVRDGRRDEPRNFEATRREDDRDPDAPAESELRLGGVEDINTNGSER
jgi:hypothetical protein